MASAITHFIVGAALSLPALESRSILPRWAIPVSCGLLAVAPDLDTFAMRALDIPAGNFLGHRGFFHSPFFLILISCALAWMVGGRGARSLAILWSVCAVTHPLLDALTDGGGGVMLLFPWSALRMFFPWRPIHVSPISISRFFDKAGYILLSELPFCAAALAIGGSGLIVRKLKNTPGCQRD
jgi:inner membrane protein